MQAGLPSGEARAVELADALAALADRLAVEGNRPQQQIQGAKTIGTIMSFETPHANNQSLLADA